MKDHIPIKLVAFWHFVGTPELYLHFESTDHYHGGFYHSFINLN